MQIIEVAVSVEVELKAAIRDDEDYREAAKEIQAKAEEMAEDRRDSALASVKRLAGEI